MLDPQIAIQIKGRSKRHPYNGLFLTKDNMNLNLSNIKAQLTPRNIHWRFFRRRVPGSLSAMYLRAFAAPAPPGLTLLKLPTYDRLGQTCHPDALLHDGKVILAATPYPFGCDWYENPSLFISDDGLNFKTPNGCPNPIIYQNPDPAFRKRMNFRDHLSDNEIHFWGGKYRLLFRQCYFYSPPESSQPNHNTMIHMRDGLFLMDSPDLIHWSKKELLAQSDKNTLISPTITEQKGGRMMYVISSAIDESQTALKRYELRDELCGHKLQYDRPIDVEGIPDGKLLWHIDIVPDGDVLRGLFVLADKIGGHGSELYYTESRDNGQSFNILNPIIPCPDWQKYLRMIYRSSMIKRKDGKWDLFISAMTKKYTWHTYLIRGIKFSE